MTKYYHHGDCSEESCNVEREITFKYKGNDVIAVIYAGKNDRRAKIDVIGYCRERGETASEVERIIGPQEKKEIMKRLRQRGLEQEVDFW